jgi:secreted trypsin-like serine protease
MEGIGRIRANQASAFPVGSSGERIKGGVFLKRSRLAVVALLAIVLPSLSQAADARPVRPGADIIGGVPVTSTDGFQFMAAILDESFGGNDYNKQYCGGSLIAPTWVLTAAHCVEDVTLGNLRVAIGRTLLNSNPPQGEKIAVKRVEVHPNYNRVSLAHDAALLELISSSSFTPIRLAVAPNDDVLESGGRMLTVIGWGTVSTGKMNYPNDLRKVDVPVVDDATCGSTYRSSLDAATMVCAGAPNIDSCYGDSGGPLFDKGSRTQVGIVSWGNGCAKKRFPGVYSEVNNTAIRSWISGLAKV